ncbi:MAG: hypothetical protein Q8R16_01750 [bacterium]|nr:hypothetical protein [bacterium]
MSASDDRWAPKAERLARKIEPHLRAITTVELVHAATTCPFTAVECKDASGCILTGDDRDSIPVYELAALLSRYFASVEVHDRGMAATFTVSRPRAEPLLAP